MAKEPHTADEAGGEAVFTSDGLPSLAAPLPPPPLPPVGSVPPSRGDVGGASDGGGDAVVEEETDAATAFEAFGEAETNGWGGLSGGGAAASQSGGWEDPRRRLFRLKAELDELESQFAEERKTNEGGEGDENLQAMALELKGRLGAMGIDDSSSLATMLRGRQEDLTGVIQRDMEKFAAGGLAEGMENLSLSKEESKEGSGDGGKILYELYKEAGAKSSSTVPREALLEERLRRLELALGTTSDGDNKPILERIEEAEKLAKEVDAKQIEKLAAKAKVVRADLEAAARAKAKLASKSSNANAQQKEDAQKVAALHSQLVELEGISAHLPALTVRLLELSNLHSNAAEFASRLDAAESAVGRSEGMLTSVEAALSKMEGGWKENMEVVERNVKRLDELLAAKSP